MLVSHVRLVRHGDHVTIGGMKVSCLFTPCHTTGHICYYVTQVSKRDLYVDKFFKNCAYPIISKFLFT